MPFSPKLNRTTLSIRKMANQQKVNPKLIKATVIFDLRLKYFVRTPRHLFTLVLMSKRMKKCKEMMPK